MPEKAWKSFERRIADGLGGRRIPVPESQQRETDQGDVAHPVFFVECKKRKNISIPAWWKQTQDKAKALRKIPLLCISSERLRRPIIVMNFNDFKRLYRRYEACQNIDLSV